MLLMDSTAWRSDVMSDEIMLPDLRWCCSRKHSLIVMLLVQRERVLLQETGELENKRRAGDSESGAGRSDNVWSMTPFQI